MKRFLKFSRGEKGFTLIELLIVVAILGILAAVIIPNATGFMLAGRLNAANTELANVKTAAVGYMAEHNGIWATTTTDATGGDLDPYITGSLKAIYTFSSTPGEEGLIESAAIIGDDGWGSGITFYKASQLWERTQDIPS